MRNDGITKGRSAVVAAGGRAALFSLTQARFCALGVIIAAVNGAFEHGLKSTERLGLAEAALAGFGVSKLVWLVLAIGVIELWRASSPVLHTDDIAWFAPGLLVALAPPEGAGWLGATMLISTAGWRGGFRGRARVGLTLLLAVSISQIAGSTNKIFGHIFQSLDAGIVHSLQLLAGNDIHRIGHLLIGNDGQSLLISAACSSFANVLIALLTWFSLTTFCAPYWRRRYYAAGAAVLTITWALNIVRLFLMSLSPDWYEFFHDGPGVSGFRLMGLGGTVIITIHSLGSFDAALHRNRLSV